MTQLVGKAFFSASRLGFLHSFPSQLVSLPANGWSVLLNGATTAKFEVENKEKVQNLVFRRKCQGTGPMVKIWRFRNQPQIILQFRDKCAFTLAINISLTEIEIHNKLYITFNLVAENKAFKILDKHVPSVEENTLKWYFGILAFQGVMWKNLCDSNKILKWIEHIEKSSC